MTRRAAFLDRDGVINIDHGYVGHVGRFELAPGAAAGMRLLSDAGYLLIVVTNQSGIGRACYSLADFFAVTRHMECLLATSGVHLAHVAFCPHRPDEDCNCRKPRSGMILDSAARLNVDLSTSVLIGDNASDIAAGRSAGVARCYLVGGQADARDADAAFPDLLACARMVVAM